MSVVYIIGTCDTKNLELTFAKECVRKGGADAVIVDVSTMPHQFSPDVTAETVAACHPDGVSAVLGLDDRGQAVGAMSEALANYLQDLPGVDAVLGLGGSGNTAIVTAGMRALPVGTPKLMVSTMASGNVAPYVGPTDIAMMYSVADIAGLNAISSRIISNAAHAAAGMALASFVPSEAGKPSVGMTMFGVTTPCISAVREKLENENECFVFHATGTGGQSMEKLVDSGLMSGCIDITTTEVADYLVGGVLACTDDRFGSIIRTQVPYVGSVGAVDMVNFGARDTVPDKFDKRLFHVHNPQVTLMRTTADENRAIGEWIVERLNRMSGPVRFLLPLNGVSAIDTEGGPFYDSEADEALFGAIRDGWKSAPNRKLIEIDAHINDSDFADGVVEAYRQICARN